MKMLEKTLRKSGYSIDELAKAFNFTLLTDEMATNGEFFDQNDFHTSTLFVCLALNEKHTSFYRMLSAQYQIVLVTTSIDKALLRKAFSMNFCGVCEYNYFIEFTTEVLIFIKQNTGFYVSPDATKFLLESHYSSNSTNYVKFLTKQENAVTACLQKGFSYKETAACLKLSLNTIRMHIKNVYKKVNVSSKYNLLQFLEHNNIAFDLPFKKEGTLPNSKYSKYKLTKRENEIFNYIQNGYDAKEIAMIMSIQLKFINTYIKKIKKKLTSTFKLFDE